MAQLVPSIFNDVIGPVMRGPSSSHSAASVRIGLLLHDLMGGRPDEIHITFDKLGSLATTHESQGTDMGLFAGLLGWQADDPRMAQSPEAIRQSGAAVSIELDELHDVHPNTYRIELRRGDRAHQVIALSTGGGMIELVEIDGRQLRLYGDSHVTIVYGHPDSGSLFNSPNLGGGSNPVHGLQQLDGMVIALSSAPLDLSPLEATAGVEKVRSMRPVLPVQSGPEVSAPYQKASDLDGHLAGDLDSDEEADAAMTLDRFAINYECQRGGISESEVLDVAQQLVDVMRTSVRTGLAGTSYDDRILGNQSGRFAQMRQSGQLLDGGLLNRMIEYVTALMEAKSAMEVIVAAPTAGACATFPGALLATADEMDLPDEQVCRAMLAGGLIGVFITNRSSFAAEVGGCQAETGAGAAMAAASLVTMAGGSAQQALSAASQALQNVLGLICDPVANRVEAPCLGRNVTGAANALSCANMALAGYDHLIPFDEVVDAHRQVSELMARELRCTGLGGLAQTPTAQRIELDLTRHRRP